MSAKTSLFAKIRAAARSLGRSERTAARTARRLETASFGEFRRLTPEQNVKQGRSPMARHYVLKTAKRVTKATPSISARQYETKRARELYKLTPEQATVARRQGAIRYVSADQRERVAKAAITREENKVVAEIKKLRASGETVPSNSPDKRRHGSSYPISAEAEHSYRAIRRRKLAGEHIADGEWRLGSNSIIGWARPTFTRNRPRRLAKLLLGPKMFLQHGEVRFGVPVDLRRRLRHEPFVYQADDCFGGPALRKRPDRLARVRRDEEHTG
jgi:hypothetical protein